MKRKMAVAVIDSGVNTKDSLLEGIEIEDLYYENQEFKTCYAGNLNSHGTEIIKVLLKEAPDVKILSIRTLSEDNRCMLSAIINAIKYCIGRKVNVINLSLGSCKPTTKRLNELKAICDMAVENGIVMFAADHNMPGFKSYPANFKNVIGVTTQETAVDYCKVSYGDMVVEFSDNMVYIPDTDRSVVRKGNSYLCPYLVGLYCRFSEHSRSVSSNTIKFMEFMKTFSSKDNISKIYFNKYDEKDQYLFSGKKVLFFADDMDFNNMKLYEMYGCIADISMCFHELYPIILEERFENIDIFFIGALSNRFINENGLYLEKLIELLINKSIHIVTVFPLISTYERMEMVANLNGCIKSIYK